jgi:hypothetical protein
MLSWSISDILHRSSFKSQAGIYGTLVVREFFGLAKHICPERRCFVQEFHVIIGQQIHLLGLD